MASSVFPTFPNPEITRHLCLYSLEDNKQHKLNFPPNLRPIASSRGWLAFSDESGNYPFLLNPPSMTRIHLPPKPDFISQFYTSNIQKVLVSASTQNPTAIISYGYPFELKIAFCRLGDQRWSNVDREGTTYYDVVCCDQTNTAFALGPGLSVDSWDLNDAVPEKKTLIGQGRLELDNYSYPSDFFATRFYLASSYGHIFLIIRYIEEFETYEGEVVKESDYSDENCPYRTVDFHVYGLDCNAKEWVQVDYLGDYAMLLGGNYTRIVSTIGNPELENNAIYFTDDFWEKLDEDCFYGGHDMGIFRLEDGSIDEILDSDQECKSQSVPPFWISLPRTFI